MFWRTLRFLMITVMIGLVAGCGFHLRGQSPIADRFKTLYLKTPSPFDQFSRQLKDALHHNGVQLVSCPNQAFAGLYITNILLNHDTPTLSNSATARVYRYYYQLDYQLKTASGHAIGPKGRILASRFTTLNAGTLIETNNQVPLLERGLYDDAIEQLLNRLSRYNACDKIGALEACRAN